MRHFFRKVNLTGFSFLFSLFSFLFFTLIMLLKFVKPL